MVVTYLKYVIPFLKMIAGEEEGLFSNVFLFGDKNIPWETNQLTTALKRETGKWMGEEITNNLFRHISVAIDREFIRRKEGEDSDNEDSEDESKNVYDTMAAHTKRLGDAMYARVKNLTSGLIPEAINLFRQVCDRHHGWLGMAPRDAKPSIKAARLETPMSAIAKTQEIDRVMTELFGFGWQWKTEKQRDSVERAISGISPLFIILPTGGGKTLSFMVPVMMKGKGVTVVVTPLVALGEDLIR